MDKYIDARFARVEKTLANLIDSIAKYNPSTSLASELLTADEELSKGLEQVQQHQNNHLRIQALRAEADALDGQIKAAIMALAASRKEISAMPDTMLAEGGGAKNYDFTYEQLMSYARRISRNTVPAPGQTDASAFYGPAVHADAALTAAAANTPGTVVTTPGAMTPAANGGAQMDVDTATTPAAAATATVTAAAGAGPSTAAAGAAAGAATPAFTGIAPPASVPNVLPPDFQQYVSPATGTVFFPWPMPELMQHGGLRALQAAVGSSGQNGAPMPRIRFVSLEEQEEQARAKAAREAQEREERERRMAEEEAAAAAAAAEAGSRRQAVAMGGHGRPGGTAQPAQFSLSLDLDDDE